MFCSIRPSFNSTAPVLRPLAPSLPERTGHLSGLPLSQATATPNTVHSATNKNAPPKIQINWSHVGPATCRAGAGLVSTSRGDS
jgi:hypothetical protein